MVYGLLNVTHTLYLLKRHQPPLNTNSVMTLVINDEIKKEREIKSLANICICIFCFARIETFPPFSPKKLDPTIQNMKEIAKIFHHMKYNGQIPIGCSPHHYLVYHKSKVII